MLFGVMDSWVLSCELLVLRFDRCQMLFFRVVIFEYGTEGGKSF